MRVLIRCGHFLACALTFLALTSGWSGRAHAQGWLEDRERAEGSGIRLGNLELHPGIGVETGYDSNVFVSDNDEQGSVLLRVTPHLLLSTLGEERRGEGEERGSPPAIAFRGGLSTSLYHYFATSATTNVGADLDLQLVINPERPFQVTVSENFSRTIRPFTEEGSNNYGRDRNAAGIKFDFGTEGEVFKVWTGYTFGVDLFEGNEFDFGTNLTHTANAGTLWRFLPHTSVHYDVEMTFQDFSNPDPDAQILLSQNTRLRTRFGINGAFTNKFGMLALVGFGAGFYDGIGDDYEGVIGQLELRFQLATSTRLNLGYTHDFLPSYVGGFAMADRGYANLQVLIGGAFLVGLELGAALQNFGAVIDAAGDPAGSDVDRSDVKFDGSLFAEYRMTDWLAANVNFTYAGNFTDFNYLPTDADGDISPDPAEYQKFETWLGLRAFY